MNIFFYNMNQNLSGSSDVVYLRNEFFILLGDILKCSSRQNQHLENSQNQYIQATICLILILIKLIYSILWLGESGFCSFVRHHNMHHEFEKWKRLSLSTGKKSMFQLDRSQSSACRCTFWQMSYEYPVKNRNLLNKKTIRLN